MKLFKVNIQLLPFLILILLSIVLSVLAYSIKNLFFQNIFINMAATSIYALIALFTYDRVKNFADREQTKELRNYALSEIDPQIMSILIEVSRVVYSRTTIPDPSLIGPSLENLTKLEIKDWIKDREFLGFEIFRNSEETTKNIRKILENSFIRPLLDNDLVLTLIKLTNRLENLYRLLSQQNNIIDLNKSDSDKYKIFGSKDISSYNAFYPNRKLLVKKIPKKEGMGVVEQFADFSPQVDESLLLKYFKIKKEKIDVIADNLIDILTYLKKWISERVE